MNHLKHWQIEASPFIAQTTGPGFYCRGSVDEAVARIGFLIQNNQRLGLLTGAKGVGRSTLLRNLKQPLRKSNTGRFPHLIYVSSKGISALEFVQRIANSFRSPIPAHSPTTTHVEQYWKQIDDEFLAVALQDEQIVLLIDDVDHATPSVQTVVARLMQLRGRPTCVLAFDDTSDQTIAEWMISESDLRIELPQWDLAQTADYFEFALDRVHAAEGLFDSQAITRIQELANGLPRRIIQLAELGLVAGAVQKVSQISAGLIEQVADEIPGFDAFEFAVNSRAHFPTHSQTI
jgi:type II secretory pathway predicted ATPase ExeA